MDQAGLRQELRRRIDRLPALLEAGFERTDLLPGVVYERNVLCGRPGCRCAKGHPHQAVTLSTWRSGKRKTVRLPSRDEQDRIKVKTAAYRRVRKAHADFNKWCVEVRSLLDTLERSRTVSYQPAKTET